MPFSIDFHTHTYHSYDCMMRPEKILHMAKIRGLNGIVINDHDTIKGGLECQALNKEKDLLVIVGAEIKTNVGDITGLFLKEEIQQRNYIDVIHQIKNQGGITILNHPYHGHKLEGMNFNGIDLVEGYNARVSAERNQMAVQLAIRLNKPVIAGSDSHIYNEIGNARTFYNDATDLLKPVGTECHRNVFYADVVSQLIKAGKTKSITNIFKWLTWTPKYLYNRATEKKQP